MSCHNFSFIPLTSRMYVAVDPSLREERTVPMVGEVIALVEMAGIESVNVSASSTSPVIV